MAGAGFSLEHILVIRKFFQKFFEKQFPQGGELQTALAIAHALGGIDDLLFLKAMADERQELRSRKVEATLLGGKVTIEIVFTGKPHELTPVELQAIEWFVRAQRKDFCNEC